MYEYHCLYNKVGPLNLLQSTTRTPAVHVTQHVATHVFCWYIYQDLVPGYTSRLTLDEKDRRLVCLDFIYIHILYIQQCVVYTFYTLRDTCRESRSEEFSDARRQVLEDSDR